MASADRRTRSFIIRATMASLLTVLALFAGQVSDSVAASPQEGKVTLMLNAKSPFDPYVTSSTPAEQEWVRETFWRVRAYPPFFDRALGWAPTTYFYKDLYAIYRETERRFLDQHPDWFLRDSNGRPLYIPYACSGGTCPQYAADIGNPEWREHWIDIVRAEMEKGYIGVHVDDVNLDMTVGNGDGERVRPIDPRTGNPMTDQNWKRYVAQFVEEIRAELPDAYISHNPVWSVSEQDPYVQRAVDAADTIELERGFSDAGLTYGTGTYGFETFMNHIDWLHDRGKDIILTPYTLDTPRKREFEIASYFLVQEGDDALAADEAMYPHNFWEGWKADVGEPLSGRYKWRGLWRRDFEDGMVLVNQPEAETQTVELGDRFERLTGEEVSSVTLPARTGAVLNGPVSDEPTGDEDPETTKTRMALDRRRAEVERTVRVIGTVNWVDAGRVKLKIKRRGGQRVHRATGSVASDGSFDLSIRKLKRGRYAVKTAYAGTETAEASQSRRYSVKVG